MRVLDPSRLLPWEEEPLTDEQEARIRTPPPQFLRRPVTEQMVQAKAARWRRDSADRAWLVANMPVGTVFDHLGSAAMVLGHSFDKADSEMVPAWRARVDMQHERGIAMRTLTVTQLRGMVEPGFVAGHGARPPAPKRTTIELTAAEVQSGHDRVRWAEGLIRQLPEDHDGRNSWLLNYGTKP